MPWWTGNFLAILFIFFFLFLLRLLVDSQSSGWISLLSSSMCIQKKSGPLAIARFEIVNSINSISYMAPPSPPPSPAGGGVSTPVIMPESPGANV